VLLFVPWFTSFPLTYYPVVIGNQFENIPFSLRILDFAYGLLSLIELSLNSCHSRVGICLSFQ